MKLTQLKLYAVVAAGPHGRAEVLYGGPRAPHMMVFTKRGEAIAARVEESGGDPTLLAAWKIVSFSPDGFMTTKPKNPRKPKENKS